MQDCVNIVNVMCFRAKVKYELSLKKLHNFLCLFNRRLTLLLKQKVSLKKKSLLLSLLPLVIDRPVIVQLQGRLICSSKLVECCLA